MKITPDWLNNQITSARASSQQAMRELLQNALAVAHQSAGVEAAFATVLQELGRADPAEPQPAPTPEPAPVDPADDDGIPAAKETPGYRRAVNQIIGRAPMPVAQDEAVEGDPD